MKKILMLSLFIFIHISLYAQENDEIANLYTQKLADKYLGIQGNGLIRELLNFGNSTANLTNPYLLIFSSNSKESNWGGNIGLGYNLRNFEDEDGFVSRNTKISDFHFRIGFEKKIMFGEKFIMSHGFDILLSSEKNETVSKSIQQSNNSTIKTIVKSTGWGFGPRSTFGYIIAPNFIISTEATYYFRKTSQDSSFTNNGVEGDKTNLTLKQLTLDLPLVLYLTFKF